MFCHPVVRNSRCAVYDNNSLQPICGFLAADLRVSGGAAQAPGSMEAAWTPGSVEAAQAPDSVEATLSRLGRRGGPTDDDLWW